MLLAVVFSVGLGVAQAKDHYPFVTDVPGVQEAMLSPDYWVARLADSDTRMSPAQVRQFNQRAFAVDANMHDLDQLPAALSRKQLESFIARVSRPASSPRYHAASGQPVSAADYRRWLALASLDTLGEQNPVRWGLAVKRASMRSFPTAERVLKTPDDVHLDRFQETAVFPGERLAVLHSSADGQWFFALNYHYAAWLPRDAVALGSRTDIAAWQAAGPRLVVTGDRVHTNFNPLDARSSELPLEMGVSLPLVDPEATGFAVNGQNPYASYIVSLPLRTAAGELEFGHALVARSRDVSVGHLPYRADLVVQQAFKFLGERYGWGHDYNARDCTGFIGEVYKSFGLLMPRNTGQQAAGEYAPTLRFDAPDVAGVRSALHTLQAGDLIYLPGHVVMYLGTVAGEPYVIHDRTALAYLTAAGETYQGILAGVSVTPLSPLLTEAGQGFVASIYAIKRIALEADW
ncbi:SH3 domain-containing protein [Seongchinamella sediminis]|nr:SH3 domain-containing protein [Seongchinamella sediminis]